MLVRPSGQRTSVGRPGDGPFCPIYGRPCRTSYGRRVDVFFERPSQTSFGRRVDVFFERPSRTPYGLSRKSPPRCFQN